MSLLPPSPWQPGAEEKPRSPTSLALLSHRFCCIVFALRVGSPLVLWPRYPCPRAEVGTSVWLLAVPGMSRMEGRLFLQTLQSTWMQEPLLLLGLIS